MLKRFIKQTTLSNRIIRWSSTVKVNTDKMSAGNFEAVFSFPSIKYISILNRLKVYQIIGTSIAVPSCGILEALDALPTGVFWSSAYMGITGAAVMSLATLPFRNTIGFLYISKDNEQIKISFMDFWGRRKDKIVPVDDWIPLLELSPKKMDPIYLQPQLSDGSEYKLFIKFGKILNPSKMGEYLE